VFDASSSMYMRIWAHLPSPNPNVGVAVGTNHRSLVVNPSPNLTPALTVTLM